tara:strand:+ start:1461 stop:1700 length:240 start_codon:yes stop_codon:yes gene_type:complete
MKARTTSSAIRERDDFLRDTGFKRGRGESKSDFQERQSNSIIVRAFAISIVVVFVLFLAALIFIPSFGRRVFDVIKQYS